jgi:hypothetical protein
LIEIKVELRMIAQELPMSQSLARGARIEICDAMNALDLATYWLAGEYG